MTEPLPGTSGLATAVKALRDDLLAEGGPRISTMRNYRFAILAYDPRLEFDLRGHIRRVTDELKGSGWNVLAISLQQLFLDRLRKEDPKMIERLVAREKRLFERDPDRALNDLRDKLALYIEGPEGIAKDVIDLIDKFADEHQPEPDKTVIFLGRAGALYPFFRSSALLKHIDGKTRNIPVVLLYPGEHQDVGALSFMEELPADRDYRPRIYAA